MTRLEENGMVIAEINKKAKLMSPMGDIAAFQLGTIATLLGDISKSLAILADKSESEKETDEDLISRKQAEECCLNGWNKDYKEILEDIRKLPHIKVGNSNSPTVKYCIDEVQIYDLLEHYAEKVVEEHKEVRKNGD